MCSKRMPHDMPQASIAALMYSGPLSQRMTCGLPRQAMTCVSVWITRSVGSGLSDKVSRHYPYLRRRLCSGAR